MILGLALLQVPFLLAHGFRAPDLSEDLVDMLRAFSFETGRSPGSPPTSAGETMETYPFLKHEPDIGDDGILGPYEGKICFEKLPYCMIISGTTRIEDPGNPKKKPILRTDKTNRDEVCYADFQVRNCDDTGFKSKIKRIDFGNVKVKDFCAPGKIEFEGTLDVGIPVTTAHTVYAAFKNADGIHMDEHRSLKPCPGSDYCFLKDVDEVLKWNEKCGDGDESLPCQTPVKKGTYTLDNVKINLTADPFENSTLTNGLIFGKIVVYVDNGPLSCAFISFRRFTRHFIRGDTLP